MKRALAVGCVVAAHAAIALSAADGCSSTDCTETQTCPNPPSDAAAEGDGPPSGSQEAAGDEAASEAAAGTDGQGGQDSPPTGAESAPEGAVSDAEPIEAGAEGSAPGYCASLSTRPVFCDDFDEHPLPGPWATLREVGGTLGEDNAASFSPPNSLRAVDSALQSGQPLDTALRIQFPLPAPPGATVLDFQWQAAAVDPTAGGATVFAALDFTDPANNRYTVQLTLVNQGIATSVRLEEQSGYVDGGSSYVGHPLPDPIVSGSWTEIRVVVNRTSSSAASAQVTFNGKAELDTPLAMTVGTTMIQLAIGSSYESEPSGGWTQRYDNVKLEFQP